LFGIAQGVEKCVSGLLSSAVERLVMVLAFTGLGVPSDENTNEPRLVSTLDELPGHPIGPLLNLND
jgi:hypothetical protein